MFRGVTPVGYSKGKMCEEKNAGIFTRRAMVDQASQGLCYQRVT